MIYKIPIYVEVEVEGDFVPAQLNTAVDIIITRKILTVLNESGGFPHTTSDVFDQVGLDFATMAKVRKAKISLINRSIAMKKIADRK